MLTIKMQPFTSFRHNKNLFDITTCDEVKTVYETDKDGKAHIKGVVLVRHAQERSNGQMAEQRLSLQPDGPDAYQAIYVENPHGNTVAAYVSPQAKP